MLFQVDESSEFLPLVYEPASISAYWGKRPRAVATRIVQLLSVAGGFLSRLAWDVINKKVKEVMFSPTLAIWTYWRVSDCVIILIVCTSFWYK